MSEDGVKKSSNPMVALTTGCVAGNYGRNYYHFYY